MFCLPKTAWPPTCAVYYGTPFISGKDSLNNMYLGKDNQRHAIPPTLLISAIGVIDDLARTVTMDLKQPGSRVYLVGDFRPVLGGSHLHLLTGLGAGDPVPGMPGMPGMPRPLDLSRALYGAIRQSQVRACHDLSEGGLAVSAAEMCIGGRLGMECFLPPSPFSPDRGENGEGAGDEVLLLFGETNGCLLVEVAPEHAARFETLLSGLPHHLLGEVTRSPSLVIRTGAETLIDTTVADLVRAWQTPN